MQPMGAVKTGTCRVIREDNRWHVVMLMPTGMFGLGGDKWSHITLLGYRSKRRANRKAGRAEAKAFRRFDKRDRERNERLQRSAAEDAWLRRLIEGGQDESR